MSGLARFIGGFSSGYRKQQEIRKAAHPQVTSRAAFLVICAVMLLLAGFTYWLMTLDDATALSLADKSGSKVLAAGKALYAFAIIGGLWAYLHRRRKQAGK